MKYDSFIQRVQVKQFYCAQDIETLVIDLLNRKRFNFYKQRIMSISLFACLLTNVTGEDHRQLFFLFFF